MKPIGRNVAFMAVFAIMGLTLFAENVRTVQIIGLFACGAAFGVSLVGLIAALKANRKPE